MHLHSDALELDISPEQGMTIVSLRLRDAQQNILWERDVDRHPTASRDIGPPGEASIDTLHDRLIGGWFEMSPHAGLPGVLDGRETMLHGEAPRLPWHLDVVEGTVLEASTSCVRYPLELRRRIVLDGARVSVSSKIRNMGAAPVTITHGEHPCFSRAVFAGGTIGANARRAYVPPPLDIDHASLREGEFAWPHAPATGGGYVDASQIPLEADGTHNHVSLELAEPWVTLTTAHARRVTIEVDLDSHPYVLLWMSYRAPSMPSLGKWDVFAIEPMTAPGRSIPDAIAAGRTRRVEPGGQVSFSCAISVSTPSD
jgi:galactose mutarotase-like enzyme